MKNWHFHSVAVISLVLASNSAAQTVQPLTVSTPPQVSLAGTFKRVVGQVWLGLPDNARSVTPGERLHVGQQLSTGPEAGTSLVLRDGTVLALGPDTTLELQQFQFDTTTQQGQLGLSLLQGSLRVVTGLLSKINPERFRIQTPTAIVGVRGTDFIVQTQALSSDPSARQACEATAGIEPCER